MHARTLVRLSRRASLFPLALTGDGRTLFATLNSKAFAGIVRVDTKTDRVTRIRTFADRLREQASGSFDGRWLVWAEYHSLSDVNDFTIWSWDARTGASRQIGAAERDPAGEFWPSPLRHPDAKDGYATWTQGSGDDGLGDVHVVDLATGNHRTVRHGHAQGSVLISGHRVVWPESLKPGAFTEMLSADASTGEMIDPAPALRRLRGIPWLATDGKTIAFPSSNYAALWWSPSLATQPRRVYPGRFPTPINVPVQIAGRYVSFIASPNTYFADGRLGRYLPISPGGYALLDAKSMVLVTPTAKKANHPIADVHVYSLSSLPPIPPCR